MNKSFNYMTVVHIIFCNCTFYCIILLRGSNKFHCACNKYPHMQQGSRNKTGTYKQTAVCYSGLLQSMNNFV